MTSRNNQSVKQELTKNSLGIGVAIATLVAVPAVALTIWGVKHHKNNSEQDQHEKNKNFEKVDNNKTDKNKAEKLLDFLVEFLLKPFDCYSFDIIDKNIGGKVGITEKSLKQRDSFVTIVFKLLECIQNRKLEINEIKKVKVNDLQINKEWTIDDFNFNDNNDEIKLVAYYDEEVNEITVTKINNNFISIHLNNVRDNVTIVLKSGSGIR